MLSRMPPKKKPLEDARKRLQEKLNNVEEQSEYISQFIGELVNKASYPAKELLQEKDRKKFFKNYSSVSQELEKCLDCLLLISDSVTALGEEDTLGANEDCTSSASEASDCPFEDSSLKKADDSKADSRVQEKEGEPAKPKKKINDSEQGKNVKSQPQPVEVKTTELADACGASEKKQEESIGVSKEDHAQLNCKVKEPTTNSSSFSSKESAVALSGSEPKILTSQQRLPPTSIEEPKNETLLPKHEERVQVLHTNLNKSAPERIPPAAAISTSGQAVALPNKEQTTAIPNKGQTTAIPNKEQATTLPNKGQATTLPNKEQAASLPNKGQAAALPNKAQATALPNKAQAASLPNKGQELDWKTTCSSKPREQSKQLDQRQSEEFVPQRVERTFEKRRSGSSSSVLSDLIEDIRISPREATPVIHGKTTRVKLKSYPFINGEALEVVVTEVLSPWEFWVQPVGTELDLLMEEMCMHYARLAAGGYKGGLTMTPTVGEFCCAKFTQDDTWYRAVVTKVEEWHQGPVVEVLCVDDGTRESLSLTRLRPLEDKFSKLPCQALCCALSGVRPITLSPQSKPGAGVVSALWSQASVEWLKTKVSGAKLLGYPARISASDLVIIDLYATSLNKAKAREARLDNALPGLEFNISEMMLRAHMAQRVGQPAKEDSGSSAGSLSGASEGSLTGSCSSVSIGSSVQEGAVAQQNIASVSEKEDSCTDQSTSSRETVVHKSERLAKDVELSAVKQATSEGQQTTKDINVENESDVKEPEFLETSGLYNERTYERSKEQKGVVCSDQEDTLRSERLVAPDPGESYMSDEPPPMEGPVLLQMLMSHVVGVSEFYVHLVTPEAGLLDPMMDDLNSFYNSDPFSDSCSTTNSFQPQVGDYCCARFKEDGRWYRGLVTSLRCTVDEKEGPQYESVDVEVFHVDFGTSEWVSVSDIKPLVAKFMKMPGQVVRCQLANLVPLVIEDESTAKGEKVSQETKTENSLVPSEEKLQPEEKPALPSKPLNDEKSSPGKSRKKGGRKKRKQKLSLSDEKLVVRAAGDESCDSSELSEIEFIKHTGRQAKQTEPSTMALEKNDFPEKYLLPSPDHEAPTADPLPVKQDKTQWAPGTSELFEGLTDEGRLLVGYMVPWDPWIYQQLFNPTAGVSKLDITYKKPALSLNLYDTTGEEDIFINQVLIEIGLAVFVESPVHQTADTKTLKLSLNDLEMVASSVEQQDMESTSAQETHGRVKSPTSPLKDWDPMKEDFLSSKNTYAIDTGDLDIAMQGYQDLSRRVCRFYNTHSGCWKGDACPNLHVKKGDELRDLVEVFCDNMDSSVTLPDIGTWVAVRVTAIFNPGHFWVQFPYGTEPIEKRIMAAKSGFENDNVNDARREEDLESLMEKMGKFYARTVCQDPRRILPATGELCAAKYSKDEKWYRARITSVREEELQVFFVDYGNSEWTRDNHVKRMLPHFLHLPFQAVECFLGNVVPNKGAQDNGQTEEWSKDALATFQSLTEDKILIAHILSKAWNQSIYVDLFDTDKEEVHINKELVTKGFASESSHTVNNPWNIEATVNFNPHKLVGLPG